MSWCARAFSSSSLSARSGFSAIAVAISDTGSTGISFPTSPISSFTSLVETP